MISRIAFVVFTWPVLCIGVAGQQTNERTAARITQTRTVPKENTSNNHDDKRRELQVLQEEFNQAKNLWESEARQGSSSLDYTYGLLDTIVAVGNDRPNRIGPLQVQVEDDTVTRVTSPYSDPSFASNGQYNLENFLTIEGLFDLIQAALDGSSGDGATLVAASYNERYGYPTRIELSFSGDVNILSPISSRTIDLQSMFLLTVLNRDLVSSKNLWESWEISNYTYVVQVTCFCYPESFIMPHVVQVRDNDRVSAVLQSTGEDAVAPDAYPTVLEAFDIIEQAIAERYATVITTYDETYGFPTIISYDIQVLLADDERAFEFSDFILEQQVMSPAPSSMEDATNQPAPTNSPSMEDSSSTVMNTSWMNCIWCLLKTCFLAGLFSILITN